MRSKALAVLSLGVVSVAGVASAQLCDESILPNAARTYCYTDPILKQLNGVTAGVNAVQAYTDDNTYGNPAAGGVDPGVTGSNEVVWQVIGALGQASFNKGSGEAYCGYVGIPPTDINFPTPPFGRNFADGIQDCVGAVRFGVSSSSKAITGASLCWDGSNIGGVYKNIAVTICSLGQSDPTTWVDREPPAGPGGVPPAGNQDCIIDNLNFVGGTFQGIHDVEVRKSDNTVGLVGGVSDINFGEAFPQRVIDLSDAAVRFMNDHQGQNVTFLIRCNEQHGNWNGRSGGRDNLLVLHDPDGIGFPGFSGVLSLKVSRDKKDK